MLNYCYQVMPSVNTRLSNSLSGNYLTLSTEPDSPVLLCYLKICHSASILLNSILHFHIKIAHTELYKTQRENKCVEFQKIERSNARKWIYILKPTVLIFSPVKSEKNHHPVVVFLITNDSPASSNFENRQGKHWPLPVLLVPQNLSPTASFSLLMFELSREIWFNCYFSKRKQSHLVSRVDSILIIAYWDAWGNMPPKFNQEIITSSPRITTQLLLHKCMKQKAHTHMHAHAF